MDFLGFKFGLQFSGLDLSGRTTEEAKIEIVQALGICGVVAEDSDGQGAGGEKGLLLCEARPRSKVGRLAVVDRATIGILSHRAWRGVPGDEVKRASERLDTRTLGRSPRAFFKNSRARQEIVASLRAGERKGWSLGEKPEGGINQGNFRAQGGVLAEGGRENDLFAESFHIPAGVDKIAREPVEELRMGRGGTAETKVVDGLDQSATEEVSPNSVHEDAGGEGMVADGGGEIPSSKRGFRLPVHARGLRRGRQDGSLRLEKGWKGG